MSDVIVLTVVEPTVVISESQGPIGIQGLTGSQGIQGETGIAGTNGLPTVTTLYNNATPNDVITASGLQIVDASAADSHFIISPKGAGSIANQTPTSTYPLGYYSVSFGVNLKTQGNYSVAMGASHTIATSTQFNTAFGSSNTITAASSAFAAGNGNNISGNYSAAVGQGNVVSAATAFAGGAGNNISGIASVGLGSGNYVSGVYALSVGSSNTTTQRCGVTFGEQVINNTKSKITLGVYGTFRSATGITSLQVQTDGMGGSSALTADGSSVLSQYNQLILPLNTVALFEALILGAGVNGANCAFKMRGVIKVGASYSSTTVSGVTTETIINPNPVALPYANADTVNGGLTLFVNDDNDASIRYSAVVTTTEVRMT
jgi:hypothetical protein